MFCKTYIYSMEFINSRKGEKMKYEVVEVEEDLIELRYKDKKFQSKRNLELVKDFEDLERKAKIQFVIDLQKDGYTTNDLVKEVKDGNKTYMDYSSLDYLQKEYVDRKRMEFFQDFCKKITGMSLEELITDIGITQEESLQFGLDFAQLITGIKRKDFPSKKETK